MARRRASLRSPGASIPTFTDSPPPSGSSLAGARRIDETTASGSYPSARWLRRARLPGGLGGLCLGGGGGGRGGGGGGGREGRRWWGGGGGGRGGGGGGGGGGGVWGPHSRPVATGGELRRPDAASDDSR